MTDQNNMPRSLPSVFHETHLLDHFLLNYKKYLLFKSFVFNITLYCTENPLIAPGLVSNIISGKLRLFFTLVIIGVGGVKEKKAISSFSMITPRRGKLIDNSTLSCWDM